MIYSHTSDIYNEATLNARHDGIFPAQKKATTIRLSQTQEYARHRAPVIFDVFPLPLVNLMIPVPESSIQGLNHLLYLSRQACTDFLLHTQALVPSEAFFEADVEHAEFLFDGILVFATEAFENRCRVDRCP